ncbi:hypothetical protein K9N08_03065 [Candidatus Gracilibacteria bacterium]|nr:hypothetical protein [Candidatus Gracilibacteria bacterium]MCF7856511.1 hypothetical protein [Candidatus Gracilibacteria bacterium]MCF7896593.1 hypothetical protein [Candidatus Gracilibacteria bacterium]
MFETSKDILNFSLAVGFGMIAIFLSIALFYAIFVLRDIGETTKAMKRVAKQANNILIQPTKMLAFLFSKAKTISEIVEKNIAKKNRKK